VRVDFEVLGGDKGSTETLEANLGADALLRAAARVRRIRAWIEVAGAAVAVVFAFVFALVAGLLREELAFG